MSEAVMKRTALASEVNANMKLTVLLSHVILLWTFTAQVTGEFLWTVPNYGTLNGTIESSTYTNRPFHAFRSVFYAEMPTPEIRFLPPVRKAPYPEDEIIDATQNNLGCPQPFGQEDCLSLNIFTPNLPEDPQKVAEMMPVMVWIHGGSFRAGQALEYLPGRFMEHDIVVVVIQYRLGPLGFLCFDTDEVPGNAGIFDQVEALRWVRDYIQYFGGNPDLVTIAGESAGSASVSTLLLTPQAKGLFHRVIGESGSILAEWALDRDDRGKIASMEIAKRAGCQLEPYESLLECVRTVDAKALIEAYQEYRAEDVMNGGLGFSGSNPVIQKAGKERAIVREPREIFESGDYSSDVPIMFGANKQEGVLVLAYTYNDFLVPNNLTEDEDFLANELVPVILKSLHIRDDTGALADALTDKYLADAEMGNFTSMTPGLTDMCSVLFLKSPGYETVRLHSKNNPHSYFYSFNFEARNSMFIYLFVGNWPPIPHGVGHADEMIYLWIFPFPSKPPGLNETEEALSMKMLQVWTNFMVYGEPTPEGVELLEGIPKFEPYKRENEHYMAIDNEWELKLDYTQTYTVTVDELPLHQQPPPFFKKSPDSWKRHNIKSPYLPW